MIDLNRQEALFIQISGKLPKPMTVYAIGGTAMMLQALKESTLDIDLVFSSQQDRETFRQSVQSLAYQEIEAHKIYGARPRAPLVASVEDARIDLFTRDVLGVYFSDAMIKRARQIHQFGGNLFIRPADFHDVIIMKSATSRLKDEEDIAIIVNTSKVDWSILIAESDGQVRLGNEAAVLSLGEKLEKLSNKKAIEVPKPVLDALWKLLARQVRKKANKKK